MPDPVNAAEESSVLEALAQRSGARLHADAYGTQAVYDAPSGPALAAGFVALLPDLGVIEVRGEQAGAFLHAQLTNDVEHLRPGEARWYGYCSPKGRLLLTGLGWKSDDAFALTVARPLAESLRKRLSMYVLRTRAKVIDASSEALLVGLGGAGAPEALAALGFGAVAPMTVAVHHGLAVVGLQPVTLAPAIPATDPVPQAPSPPMSVGRWLLRVPLARAAQVWDALAQRLQPVSSEAWRWLEVRAGIPRIVAETSERFVPQMINFEVVGGVDFKKGCYPGQEVVARSQYLGKLKRRMYLGHVDGDPPAPGSDVSAGGGGEPVGQVVLAARAPGGGADLLFEALSAATGAGLLSSASGTLRIEALPYALPG